MKRWNHIHSQGIDCHLWMTHFYVFISIFRDPMSGVPAPHPASWSCVASTSNSTCPGPNFLLLPTSLFSWLLCFVSGIIISPSPVTKPQRTLAASSSAVPIHRPALSILLPSGQMLLTFVISFPCPLPCTAFRSSLQAWAIAPSHSDIPYFLSSLPPPEHPSYHCLINLRVMSESTVGVHVDQLLFS